MNSDTLPVILKPPTWSLLVGSAGSYLVLAATLLYVASVVCWLFFPERAKRAGALALTFGSLCLIGAFLALGILFVTNRFEYQYVFGHGDNQNAIPYRIAGIWSGQQGSFLLWGVCSSIFTMLVARKSAQYRRWFSVSSGIFLGCIAAILAFESPFFLNLTPAGTPFVPPDGAGMAPSLQNYWVTIHPPTIFMGFGSLTALFALAFAALMVRDFEGWVPIVRPWAIVSMSLVGVGLCMGGFWAYETLGWGGFWMWDPVENTSFVPWCFTVALTHGLLVQATRKKWQISNLLLGGLPFLTFMYGTFLTRSGFLADASVHSFAEMNRSALKLLIGVVGLAYVAFGIAWGVRAYQARKATKAEAPGVLRRDALMKVGMISISVLGLATAVGMSVPFFMALNGKPPKVVEEGLYHQVIPWFYVPIMLLLAVAPMMGWKASSLKEFAGKIYSIACIAIGLTGVIVFAVAASPASREITLNPPITFLGHRFNGLPWLLFLVGLSFFALVGNVWRISLLWRGTKVGLAPYLTHIGVTVLMTGLIVSRGFERVDQTMVMEGHPGQALDYLVSYKGMTSTIEDRDNHVKFQFASANRPDVALFTATPGLYNVHTDDGQTNVMVWPHIQKSLFQDVYVALRPPQNEPMGQEVMMHEGDQIAIAGGTLKYIGLDRQGQPGVPGTKFGAKLKLTTNGVTRDLLPQLELGQPGAGGLQHHPAKLDSGVLIDLQSMNVADKSVTIDVGTNMALYPLEIFHKPLTGLVWLGAAIMGAAGFLAAWNRRSLRRAAAASDDVEEPAGARKLALTA